MIRNLRLGLLTIAWGAALVTILSGQAHGFAATCGAGALGLFILLTLPRLRRDSLIILAMLGVVMLFILDDVPSFEDMIRGGERVLIFAALLPTMALVRATAMTMPSVHATQERLGAPATGGISRRAAAGCACVWRYHKHRRIRIVVSCPAT
jgi:hypothetical protein